MIQSEYYEKYRGPHLTNEDITEKIKEFYGEKKNWSGCLWTYNELFGPDSQGKHFRCDFKGEDDRTTCMISIIKFNFFILFCDS
jgi:hypothetical protein